MRSRARGASSTSSPAACHQCRQDQFRHPGFYGDERRGADHAGAERNLDRPDDQGCLEEQSVVASVATAITRPATRQRFSVSNANAKGTASSPASIRPIRAAFLNSGVQTGMRAAREVIASLR